MGRRIGASAVRCFSDVEQSVESGQSLSHCCSRSDSNNGSGDGSSSGGGSSSRRGSSSSGGASRSSSMRAAAAAAQWRSRTRQSVGPLSPHHVPLCPSGQGCVWAAIPLGADHVGYARIITRSLASQSHTATHEYTMHYYWVSSINTSFATASPSAPAQSAGGRPVGCGSRGQLADLGAGQATFNLAVGLGTGVGIGGVSAKAFCS